LPSSPHHSNGAAVQPQVVLRASMPPIRDVANDVVKDIS
jgi:hypothetical protein